MGKRQRLMGVFPSHGKNECKGWLKALPPQTRVSAGLHSVGCEATHSGLLDSGTLLRREALRPRPFRRPSWASWVLVSLLVDPDCSLVHRVDPWVSVSPRSMLDLPSSPGLGDMQGSRTPREDEPISKKVSGRESSAAESGGECSAR